MPEVQPGQIWWCQGSYLGFDWQLKTRPVVVLGVKGGRVDVAILTSKSHLGSVEVAHRKGVSYLTGKIASVPREALLDYIGDWAEYPAFVSGASTRGRGCGFAVLLAAVLSLLTLCGWSVLKEIR